MIINQPTSLECMTQGADGVYRSTPEWIKKKASGSYSAVLYYDLARLGIKLAYSQWLHLVYFRRSGGFKRAGNWKLFRMWAKALGLKPNTYAGTPHVERAEDLSDPMRFFTEDLLHDKNGIKNFPAGVWPFGDNLWHRENISIKMPSAYAKTDGYVRITVDDQIILEHASFQNEGAGYEDAKTGLVPEFRGLPSILCLQMCYQDDGKTGLLPDTAYCHVANPFLEVVG